MRLGKWARRAFGCFTIAGIFGAWASVGCGGIGPGDYIFYRIASSESVRTGDCANSDNQDTTTFRTSSTFVLYAGPDDKFYLDVGQAAGAGDITLEGTVTDNGYKFSGNSVRVQDFGGSSNTEKTETQTTIDITVDGAAVSGTAATTVKVTYTCASATGCPDSNTCTTTNKFVGSRIEGVTLEHDPL